MTSPETPETLVTDGEVVDADPDPVVVADEIPVAIVGNHVVERGAYSVEAEAFPPSDAPVIADCIKGESDGLNGMNGCLNLGEAEGLEDGWHEESSQETLKFFFFPPSDATTVSCSSSSSSSSSSEDSFPRSRLSSRFV